MSHHPRIERLMPAATFLTHLLLAGVLFGAAGRLAVAHQVPAPPLAAVIGQADRASIDWWGLAAFASGLSSLVLAMGTTYVRAVRVSRHEPMTGEFPQPKIPEPPRGPDA